MIGAAFLRWGMSDGRITFVLILVFSIVISALGWLWFQDNFERRTRVERTAMGKEARRNPLLAAEMFLARLGVEVESRSGREYLGHPPEGRGLLFIRDLGPPMPRASVESLLKWVEAGGHLVVTPSDQLNAGGAHPLLRQFRITLVQQDQFADDIGMTEIVLPDKDETLQIDFNRDNRFEFEDDAGAPIPLIANPYYMVFTRGKGQVTFITDSDVFTNLEISKFDHARLMAHFVPEQGRAWLLYSAQMPSLLTLIWYRAPYLVLTLIPLIFLIIWRMTLRSGPKLELQDPSRRDLLEHLQASAEFAWYYDLKSGLMEGARYQVERRWLSAHPILLKLDDKGRCDWLAQRTGLTSSAIYQTLYPKKGNSGQLIKTTANLQRLLAALHPDRNVNY
jgi:hypothetical protein